MMMVVSAETVQGQYRDSTETVQGRYRDSTGTVIMLMEVSARSGVCVYECMCVVMQEL